MIPSQPTKLLHCPFIPSLAAIPSWCLPWHPRKSCPAPALFQQLPTRAESGAAQLQSVPEGMGAHPCLAPAGIAKQRGQRAGSCTGRIPVCSQLWEHGNHQLGWTQQPGDSEAAQVELLIPKQFSCALLRTPLPLLLEKKAASDFPAGQTLCVRKVFFQQSAKEVQRVTGALG